jgi:hypothetical protein
MAFKSFLFRGFLSILSFKSVKIIMQAQGIHTAEFRLAVYVFVDRKERG